MAIILTVDDSPSVRQMIKLVLGPAGHQVSEAADGSEGLGKAKGQRYDLVITDLRVRPGTHDARAMRRIRTMAAAA